MTVENRISKTERRIEARVERMVDRLDARFLSGTLTQRDYEAQFQTVRDWANQQYRFARQADCI